jgi:hypothetical protein
VSARDSIHETVKTAVIKNGWEITDDPYVISYGERFLFVDLGASGLIGIRQAERRIAIEIKQFRGQSQVADLEQAIGQYVLYRLLLDRVDPGRDLYLAIPEATYNDIFVEAIGKLAIEEIPLKIAVINLEAQEIVQWIPSPPIEK